MKTVAGIVVAMIAMAGFSVATLGATPEGGPTASPAQRKPVPVNEYKGIQDREEVFTFTQKPAVTKEGAKWVITFASKGKCDATVAILGPDGKIVRHLASGVLGVNAPYPFQQGSLVQKIEWDGQDNQGKPAPTGCKVKVGLGLQAKFERDIMGSRHDLTIREAEFWTSEGADGKLYVVSAAKKRGVVVGRVFEKDGTPVRTFWPPAAADLEKMLDIMNHWRFKGRLTTTSWGDKVLVSEEGPHTDKIDELVARAGGGKPVKGPLPEAIAKKVPAGPNWATVVGPVAGTRLAADRTREELYVGANRMHLYRFNAKTGELDPTWKPIGVGLSDAYVGPDGLLYLRIGAFGYGQWVVRVDHAGNPVPFDGDSYDLLEYASGKKFPDTAEKGYGTDVPSVFKGKVVKALWTGLVMHSNTHDRGLYVSPRGYIVAQMQSVCKDYAMKHGFGERFAAGNVNVWDATGKLLTADAIGPTWNGRGVGMDRDGNIYSIFGSGTVPAGQKVLDGIADPSIGIRPWCCGGTLVKFRGQGEGVYPLNVGEGSVKLGRSANPVPGALWAYGGITNQTGDCMCHSLSYDMDYFARFWIPANHLSSVMVIDANGNRIARLGRYGNVDDTDADVKAGKDGLRFAWPRALAVSDTALYVTDERNHRILKAALSFAAEETVPVP